jgi:hypothetical protein
MLPLVIGLNVLVLGPLAVVSIYSLAARMGGRLLAAWAAVLWVITPYACIPLFVDRYHERYVDQVLPQSLGLSALADYPSMVALVACAALAARALERRSSSDAALAGLVLGFAIATKAPNVLFALGAVPAFAIARRWREGFVLALAALPAVVTLALWKSRGLGEIPLFGLGETREAAGLQAPAAGINFGDYLRLDWQHWQQQMDQLREFFWSPRLAQWAPVAGLLAVARRTPALAALLGGWLAAFLVVKGFAVEASIETGSFFRLLMPAWPAYLLLLAAIPLLVPTLARRLAWRARPTPAGIARRRTVAAAAAGLAALPLLAVAVARPAAAQDASLAVIQEVGGNILLTVVDDEITVAARADGASQVLTWRAPDYGASVFYRVYRTDNPRGDTRCESSGGSARCFLVGAVVATTRAPRYVDGSPPAGAIYRIGVAANYKDDPEGGDVFALSPPVGAG